MKNIDWPKIGIYFLISMGICTFWYLLIIKH